MDELRIPELTPEQEQRRVILFDLLQLWALQNQYHYLTSPFANTLWIHVTDMDKSPDGIIDIEKLIADGILKRVDVAYQLQGDWRDRFAPSAFLLTARGVGILENPSLWVWKGEWINQRVRR